jgi:hypothetical protein
MEVLADIINWGSPLGIGLFLFFLGTGAGVFFWGVSHLNTNNNQD